VSVSEAKALYLKNPGRFEVPETFAMQSISILPPRARSATQAAASPATPEELKQMRARAEAALKQAKATRSYEEFGLLAEKISEDDYRVMMGDHKLADRSKLPPPVVKALLAMQ